MLKTYPDNLKGALILLIASLIWGSTFIPQKIAMDFWSPLQFTAIRFLIGAFLLLTILPFFGLPKKIDAKSLIIYGLTLGTLLGFISAPRTTSNSPPPPSGFLIFKVSSYLPLFEKLTGQTI